MFLVVDFKMLKKKLLIVAGLLLLVAFIIRVTISRDEIVSKNRVNLDLTVSKGKCITFQNLWLLTEISNSPPGIKTEVDNFSFQQIYPQ